MSTTLEALMAQARDALVNCRVGYDAELCEPVITALSEALADKVQPADPVAINDLAMIAFNARRKRAGGQLWSDLLPADVADWEAVAAAVLAAAPPVAPAAPVAPQGWRDHVEQRLRNWRQQKMNRSGDRLALDDFMDAESLEDLIDYVCDEWSGPAAAPPAPAAAPAEPVGVPSMVWEALQRMIEDAATRGPASREDALAVAQWRRRLMTEPQDEICGCNNGVLTGASGEFIANCQCRGKSAAAPAIDDPVTVPRGLLGAACSAIDHKRDAPKVLSELRRYTVGDLSPPLLPSAQQAATPAEGTELPPHVCDPIPPSQAAERYRFEDAFKASALRRHLRLDHFLEAGNAVLYASRDVRALWAGWLLRGQSAAPAEGARWLPGRPPNDDGTFLVADAKRGLSAPRIGGVIYNNPGTPNDWQYGAEITHHMPLPAAPTEAPNDQA